MIQMKITNLFLIYKLYFPIILFCNNQNHLSLELVACHIFMELVAYHVFMGQLLVISLWRLLLVTSLWRQLLVMSLRRQLLVMSSIELLVAYHVVMEVVAFSDIDDAPRCHMLKCDHHWLFLIVFITQMMCTLWRFQHPFGLCCIMLAWCSSSFLISILMVTFSFLPFLTKQYPSWSSFSSLSSSFLELPLLCFVTASRCIFVLTLITILIIFAITSFAFVTARISVFILTCIIIHVVF